MGASTNRVHPSVNENDKACVPSGSSNRRVSALTEAVNGAVQATKDVSFIQALWMSTKHNIWLSCWLTPSYIVLGVMIPLLMLVEKELERRVGSALCGVTLIAIATVFFYFGTWLPFVVQIGYVRTIWAMIVAMILFIIGEWAVFMAVWPSPWIFLGYHSILNLSFFVSQIIMANAARVDIMKALGMVVAVSTFVAACGTVAFVYSFVLQTITMTLVEEILIVGFGYNIIVLLLGRVFVSDFLRFYVTQAFGGSKTRASVNLGLVAKLTFSCSQVYALLRLNDGFLITLIVTNLVEMATFLINYFFVRQRVIQTTFKKAKSRFNITPSSQANKPRLSEGSEKLKFSDWMDDLSNSDPEAKFLVISLGEEQAGKSSIFCGAIFFLASTTLTGTNAHEIIIRIFALFIIEFLEDVCKGQTLFYISGVLIARLPPGVVSIRTHVVATCHSCVLFCIIRTGEMLARSYLESVPT